MKRSQEQIDCEAELRKRFQLGTLLVFHTADYHEDDFTPSGFMEVNDHAIIVENAGKLPVKERGSDKIAYYHTMWTVMTHWGTKEASEFYLAGMTRIVE